MIKFKFSLFFFFLIINHTFSQGNLQFNQVLSLTNGANVNVPAGKVWKVEAVNLASAVNFPQGSLNNVGCQNQFESNGSTTRICSFSGVYINIAGVAFNTPTITVSYPYTSCLNSTCPSANPSATSTSALNTNSLKFPIWLESGKNITIIAGSGILVSVIEFNVVP